MVSVRPTGTPGVVMLFEPGMFPMIDRFRSGNDDLICPPEIAMPTALMNATYLTALRTAAGSAVGKCPSSFGDGKEECRRSLTVSFSI